MNSELLAAVIVAVVVILAVKAVAKEEGVFTLMVEGAAAVVEVVMVSAEIVTVITLATRTDQTHGGQLVNLGR